jgi:hypothetical protein
MELLVITLHLLRFALAILAVGFCVTLFRRHHACGWLFVSAVFYEPFALLAMRAIRGRPLLAYKTVSAGSDGVMQVSYHADFPILYIVAVIGLFMLVRGSQKKTEI